MTNLLIYNLTCAAIWQVRDKRLHTGAQKRLEVKISTRKLLEKTNQKKEERKAERDKITMRMKELNVTDAPADESGNEAPKSSATPELSTNFSHYAGEVPLRSGNSPAKAKPVLTSQKPKPKTGLEAEAPLLNKHFSGYRGEVEVGNMGEQEEGSPRKQKPDLGALASLRKNRSAKASEASAGSGISDSFSAPPNERPNGLNPSPSSVAEGPELHQHYGSYGGEVSTSDHPPKPKPQLSSEGSARLEALRANRANKPGGSSSTSGTTSPRRQAPPPPPLGQSPARKAPSGGGVTPRPKPPTPRARSPRAAKPPVS